MKLQLSSFFEVGIQEFFHLFQFPFQNNGNEEQAKIIWIVKLRWLAVILFLAFGALGFVFGYPSRTRIAPYVGLVSLLVLFNFFTQVIFSNKKKLMSQVQICFQLSFDLVILTFALYLTGGIENPFVFLFLLNISLGALLIPGYLTLPFLVLTHSLVAGLQLEYISSIPGAPNELKVYIGALVFHVLIFGFWLVMRSLGHYFEIQNSEQLQKRLVLEKQDRLRAIGALAAGFSHEFTSPLNTVKIRVERLRRKANQLGAGMEEDAQEALSALHGCEEIIKKMNASQIDARSFIHRWVDLSALSEEIIEAWRYDHPGVKLRVSAQKKLSVQIPPVNYAQVLLNLLDNAWEAGGVESCIEVALFLKDGRVVLTVSDEGGGVSDLIFEKWGEPFITTKLQGTGLGLYVSQLFANSLGGELKIENKKPFGAQVTIEWPEGCGE